MLAEIFLLQLEAERRAVEMAADATAARFVPFKCEAGAVTALRQRPRAPKAA